MSQGTIHTEPIIRTRPFAGEFDGDGQAQRLAREAVRANRQHAKRAAASERRAARAALAAELDD
jgi:hypothetical protein